MVELGDELARNRWAARLTQSGVPGVQARHVSDFLWNLVKGLAVRALVRNDEARNEATIQLAVELAKAEVARAA